MELTLKANGFQEMSLGEMQAVDGGYDWDWADFGGSVVVGGLCGAAGAACTGAGIGAGALGGALIGGLAYSANYAWQNFCGR